MEEDCFSAEGASDSGSNYEPEDTAIKGKKAVTTKRPTQRAKAATATTKVMPKRQKKETATQSTIPVPEPLLSVAQPATSSKATSSTPVAGERPVEEIYQKKTQLEHILLRPDTYIGSVERITQSMWVYEESSQKMVQRNLSFVPGLFKIFDEILVNAADNKIRDSSMDTIRVDIDKENNRISIYNNGRGIPIEVHSKEKVYVPELIFGHLLTSSNYNDEERKVTGGRNGYGAKLCNIFSTEFIIETADQKRRKKFKQIYRNNMSHRTDPVITDYDKEDFTRITFHPDLAKFGMDSLDEDIMALLNRRVYDMAGCVENVKVFLNGERIKIKDFKQYVELYLSRPDSPDSNKESSSNPPSASTPIIAYERIKDRWEVCVAASDGQFQQVSFVNAICTYKGGTHVNYIADQIISSLQEALKKKHKDMKDIKPFQIKSHLSLFIKCLIENPTFDSQTKENMTLRSSAFGSTCQISEELIKKVLKCGIVENVLTWARFKQDQMLKKTDGHKKSRLSGITKLDDANNAGTKNASRCTLILTEGDSAKALAVSGLSVVGRDNFGVFPLRGKLLNVREATHKQIMENAEINQIKQILGLQHGKQYLSTETLRYGHLMIMTDQDHDGSHIKGLLINLIDHFWPSLLKVPGFLLEFITPIVKVSKNRQELAFYTIPEYEAWKAANRDGQGWNIKYYKGLGTSTAVDAQKYFSAMDLHRKEFAPADPEDNALVDMAFNKKRADERKEWLKSFSSSTYMDHQDQIIKISDFINKELILFSMADNVRSIPSVVDGLKPGHRKVLFSCFKRKLKGEIKVAQLAGYVSEHSAYHHGEQSLCSTIVGMAQNFVGSNNINLLEPIGQFGTRLQGGKDAASARYIFTSLSSFARLLYRPEDDALLKYLNDDGQSIEPEWYMPILPMVLVNGGEGIGTGWMTSIPNFNPADIVKNLQCLIDGESTAVFMKPWYHGFHGSIEMISADKFKVTGIYRKIDDTTLEITELPIGTWTQSYKEFLEGMLTGGEKGEPYIRDYKEYHTDSTVKFIISLSEAKMANAEEEGIEKKFKLCTTLNLNNLVCFDPIGRIKKYDGPIRILEEFYHMRLSYYQKRKDWMADQLTGEWSKLDNRVRFVMEIIEGKLVVQNRKRADVISELIQRGYQGVAMSKEGAGTPDQGENEEEEADSAGGKTTTSGYEYLLNMPIYSLTMEKVQKLKQERAEKESQLNLLLSRTPKDLWKQDLQEFMTAWTEYERRSERALEETRNSGNGRAANASRGRKKATANPTSTKVSLDDYAFSASRESNSSGKSSLASLENLEKPIQPTKLVKPERTEKADKPEKPIKPGKPEKSNSRSVDMDLQTLSLPNVILEPIASSSIASEHTTTHPTPIASMDLDEEELNSLPLAQRINYMLSRRQGTMPVAQKPKAEVSREPPCQLDNRSLSVINDQAQDTLLISKSHPPYEDESTLVKPTRGTNRPATTSRKRLTPIQCTDDEE